MSRRLPYFLRTAALTASSMALIRSDRSIPLSLQIWSRIRFRFSVPTIIVLYSNSGIHCR